MPPSPAPQGPRDGAQVLFVPFYNGTVVRFDRDFLAPYQALKFEQTRNNCVCFFLAGGPPLLPRVFGAYEPLLSSSRTFTLQLLAVKGHWAP